METIIEYGIDELGIEALLEIYLVDSTELKQDAREVLIDKLKEIDLHEYLKEYEKNINDFVQENFELDYTKYDMQSLFDMGNFATNPDVKQKAREAYILRTSMLGWVTAENMEEQFNKFKQERNITD